MAVIVLCNKYIVSGFICSKQNIILIFYMNICMGYLLKISSDNLIYEVIFYCLVAIEQISPTSAKNRPAGDFITVIEVNGVKVAENASKKSEESSQSSESSSAVDPMAAPKKKVPPK